MDDKIVGNRGRGRPKGSTNVCTKEIREKFMRFSDLRFDDFVDAWDRLPDRDKVNTYISMNRFVLPTLQKVDLNDVTEGGGVVDVIRQLRDGQSKD